MGGAVAVETIRAFADADLNVTKASEQVHVHPNSIRYRLAQIAANTGYDPRTFAGLVDLMCILEVIDDERGAPPAVEVDQARRSRSTSVMRPLARRRG